MILAQQSSDDLFYMLTGDKLGEGQYRTVYDYQLEKGRVIKHDTRENWSNVSEHMLYGVSMGTELEKWLAPVYWLSPGGIWLIMAKTTPIPAGKLPKKVPKIFTDLKPENWGMYKGRPVCHDYGNNAALTIALNMGGSPKLANWSNPT